MTGDDRSEDYLRRLAEDIQDVLYRYRLSPPRGFEYLSPAITALTGYSPEEHFADPDLITRLIHPDDRCLLQEAASEDWPRCALLRVIRRDGTVVWTEQRLTLIRDDAGLVVAIEGIARDVTAFKRMEEALRQAEREKETILDSLAEIVTYQDRDLRLQWVNRAACASVSLAPGQLLGRSCYEVWHRRSAPCASCPAVDALKTGRPQQGEVAGPTGRTWFIQGYPIQDESGQVMGVVQIRLETTETRRAEEETRRRAEMLAALHETALDLADQRALPDLLEAILARAVDLLQCQCGGIYLYRPATDDLEFVYVHNLDPAFIGVVLQRGEGLAGKVLQSGRPLAVADYGRWEGRALQFEGAAVTASVGVPIRWGDRLLGVLDLMDEAPRTFTTEDVALLERFAPLAAAALEDARLLAAERQRNAELEALRQASLRLTSQLELKPVLRAILDYALKLVAADDAHIFLYDGDELIFGAALWADGKPRSPIMPRPDGLTYAVVREGERIVVPDTRGHPLYRDYPWEGAIVGMPLCIGEQVVGVMNVAYDQPHLFEEGDLRVLGLLADQAAIAIQNARLYGDLQQQMEKLKSAQSHLVQSARLAAVGELAAGVAHELNNPLTSVLGFAQLLLEEIDPTLPYWQDMQRIAAEARRARDIVRNLLDFAGQVKPQKQMVDVNETLRQTLSLISEHLTKRGVVVEQSLSQVAPIYADRGQLKQVFLNLISNAAQAMAEGGSLRIHTAQMGDQVTVVFSDTGVGMSPEVRANLFQPFFTTRPGGTGLGLSVSLGIVREHGGLITVESQEGQGSTFTVWLPVGGGGAVAEGGE